MISVSRIKNAGGASAYYGKDDYYVTGEADTPGLEWGGGGAKTLGLEGHAKQSDFAAILGGKNPDPTGPRLSPEPRFKDGGLVNPHHPGWDITFSLPKSVSVAILVGGDRELDRAASKANKAMMDYAEKHFSTTRVREADGRREVVTGNLVYATTIHGTSRDGDPQRHFHNVVANMTRTKEGDWRALESLQIFRNRTLLGKIGQAELAADAQALGHDLRKGATAGTFEIDSWTRGQLGVFSKRHEVIAEAFDAVRSERGGAALTGERKERIVLYGRPDKIDRPRSELVDKWKEEAKAAGIDAEKVVSEARERGRGADRTPLVDGRVSEPMSKLRAIVADLVGRREARDPYGYAPGAQNRDDEARQAVSLALQVTELRRAVFTRHEVLERALDASRLGVTAGRLTAEMARLEKEGHIVRADKAVEAGITTAYAVAIERELVGRMAAGKGQSASVLSMAEARSRLTAERLVTEDGKALNAGQQAAVATILTTTDRFVAVQGYAGVGKTTMFDVARQVAAERGVKMMAITPTHSAADSIRKEAGMSARTITSWLNGVQRTLEKGGRAEATLKASYRDKLLVVDESSMVSNAQMQQIVRAAERLRIGHVAFSGDRRQLSSQEAGGPFRLMQDEGIRKAEMKDILRQRDPTLRESVRQIAEGRPGPALQLIRDNIVEVGKGADDKQIAEAAHKAWKAHRQAGEEAKVVVTTNALRGMTAGYIRHDLKEAGELASAGVVRERYMQVRLDGPLKHRAESYALGQRLVFHAGLRSAGLKRDDEVTIVGRDSRNEVLRVETADGSLRSIDLTPLARKGAMPFQAYTASTIEIARGERLVWERADAKRGFITGADFTVVEQNARTVTIQHAPAEKGQAGKLETIPADDPALKFTGYAYAETADRAQGKTHEHTIGVMPSSHGESATVAREYVMQSRPREGFTLITDSTALLLYRLGKQDGLTTIALQHLSDELEKAKADVKTPASPDQVSALAKAFDLEPENMGEKARELSPGSHAPEHVGGQAERDDRNREKLPQEPVRAIPDRSL